MGDREVIALDRVDVDIAVGTFTAVTGRSGSGKTTLLNLIGGLDRPTSGTVEVLGESLNGMSERELTELRRRKIGFVFQSFALLPTLSTFDNVALPLRIVGAPGAQRDQSVRECLDLVGLSEWATHKPYELSGGQQQRVAIARALVHDPPLILADEPTGELDSNTAREIFALFKRLAAERGITIMAATHDPLVDEYASAHVGLKDGRVEGVMA
jgi:ABC-type lipoprotein export system ATPase subunit